MTLDLTVVIPTIEGRQDLKAEALASVMRQTEPVSFMSRTDHLHDGPAATVNECVEHIRTKWIFRLDDDDLLDPDHFEVMGRWLTDDYDIVYTWCRVTGGGPAGFESFLRAGHDLEFLETQNFIPCAAAIRTSLFRDLGGYDTEATEEDWDFWLRALGAGARFLCVPAITWTYRMNPEWTHRSDEMQV